MNLFNPAAFQGSFKKKNYFEGWFCKHVGPDASTTLAAIPGIALGPDSHSFVQVNTSLGSSWYVRYPLSEARMNKTEFQVSIGPNHFSPAGMHLDLQTPDGTAIKGDITYSSVIPYPATLYRPGIMGPYSYVPGMECNHGLVSAGHNLDGLLRLGSRELNFSGGRGYIEKDWGRSFPSSWIWLQANSFPGHPTTSFMLSLARIPWLGSSFTGFLGYLYHEQRFYHIATYNHSEITHARVGHEDLELTVRHGRLSLSIHALREDGHDLAAPVNGQMNRTIKESMQASISLHLQDLRSGASLLGPLSSTAAGLEVSGNMEELGIPR